MGVLTDSTCSLRAANKSLACTYKTGPSGTLPCFIHPTAKPCPNYQAWATKLHPSFDSLPPFRFVTT